VSRHLFSLGTGLCVPMSQNSAVCACNHLVTSFSHHVNMWQMQKQMEIVGSDFWAVNGKVSNLHSGDFLSPPTHFVSLISGSPLYFKPFSVDCYCKSQDYYLLKFAISCDLLQMKLTVGNRPCGNDL